jgi:hypothetical protein
VERERSKGGLGRPILPTDTPPSERIGIIVAIGGPLDRFVWVIEPVFNDSDPWDGGWLIPADEPVPVWCYPPLLAEDYQSFVLEGGPPSEPMILTDDMDPLPVVRIRGVWFVKPQILWGRHDYPTGAQFSDCGATGGMP